MPTRRTSPIRQEEIEAAMCSIEYRLQILSKVPFFSDLNTPQIKEINSTLMDIHFAPAELVYFSGDPASQLFILAAGNIKLLQHTSEGKDILLEILGPGEFFGSLSASGEPYYLETAQAITHVCVMKISTEQFRKVLLDYQQISLRVLDVMTERLYSTREMLKQVSLYSVEKRIAHILIKLAYKLGEKTSHGILIQIPLSREDLADMAGTTPETTSRIMSLFEKSNLISTGRRWVSVQDLKGLTKLNQNL